MAQQLREALHGLADDAPTIVATEQDAARTWRRARRTQRLTTLASIAAVCAVVLGVVLSAGAVRRDHAAPEVSQPYDPSTLAISTWTPR